MKRENLCKIGYGILMIWETYYTYWWFTMHNEIKNDIILYLYFSLKQILL
jgi:hypothetical protein